MTTPAGWLAAAVVAGDTQALLRMFLANHNFVAGTLRARSSPANGAATVDDATVVDAAPLRALGDALRGAGYDNTPAGGPLARLALGFTVERADLRAALVDEVLLADLCRGGIAVEVGTAVRLRASVAAAGPVLAYVPRDGSRPDRVYVGADSAYLVDAAARLGGLVGGGRAADLGTGTGVVSAALALTYPVVVATDICARSSRTALLTAALNDLPAGHRIHACVTDVAHGLRAGAMDVVLANTPWVPSGAAGPGRRIFADGGPTGSELPRRFLIEGSSLLRPGGVMVALAADITYADGRSPLAEACAQLESQGNTTVVVPTGLGRDRHELADVVLPRVAGAVAAEHVAVVVSRRPVPAGLDDKMAALTRAWTGATG